MKKYIIEYDLYDDVQALLGHDVPHSNLVNVKTVIVDLTEQEYEALIGAGINIRPDFYIDGVDALCGFTPPLPLNSQVPPTQLLNYFNLPAVHAAGFTGAGVKIALPDTGQHDNHHAAAPAVIRHDFSVDQTGVSVEYQPHGGRACIIIGQTNLFTGTPTPGAPALYGMAHGAEIHSMRVQENLGGIYSSSVISAIEYAIANDFDIINISLSMGSGLDTCINAAIAAGIIVVCASGNSIPSYVAHPANLPNVIAVNTVLNGVVAGSYLTADGLPRVTWVNYCQGHTSTAGGTSQAAFETTALLAIYKQKYPSLDTPKAINLLRKKALEMDGFVGDIVCETRGKLINYRTGGGFSAPIY